MALQVLETTIEELAPRRALEERSARELGIGLWTFAHGFGTLSCDKRSHPDADAAAAAFDRILIPTLVGLFGRRAVADRRS